MADTPPPPRVNPLAVGSAPQENLTAATGRELFDMANRFFQHVLLGRPDTNRDARERNLGTPTTISRELYDAREAARNRPAPAARQEPTQPRNARGFDENILNQARNYVQRNEGFRDAAYPDPVRGAARPTIGFGTTRNRLIDEYLQGQGLDPEAVFTIGGGTRITRQQAREMEDLYMRTALRALQTRPDTRWFNTLPPQAQVVMLDMSYNLGSHFRFPRMFDALQRGDYNAAADEILDSTYAGQVGNRATRNADMMRSLAE